MANGQVLDKVVSLGPQVVAAILSHVVITDSIIDEAEIEITEQGYDFPRKRWEYIRDLGYLPLAVRALPEGMVVPIGLPIMTIENTDDSSAWLVSYIETWAQDICWVMTTIATKIKALRNEMEQFCTDTGTPVEAAEYMVHNFGDRGAGGQDRAIMAAIAHGVFFSGTDCLRANRYIKKLYATTKPYLSSVDASEHSTMCANSDLETKNDFGAFEMSLGMLKRAVVRANNGIGIPLVSAVIDTYDDERYVKEFVIPNYSKISEIGGKYVCRPDSGSAIEKPIEVVQWLIEGIGYTKTNNGFLQMPENIGVLQGDGLREADFGKIIELAKSKGLAAGNFAFGFGGGMTNGSGRDDFSFSMKATCRMDKDGNWVDMQKAPKSDIGKSSLRGRVTVFKTADDELIADRISLQEVNKSVTDIFVDMYRDGIFNGSSFAEVRVNARKAY